MVGVLVLVDQHVPEASSPVLAHRRERPEQVHGHHQQVVEVEGVGLAEPALVLGVRRGVGLLQTVARVLRCVLVVLQLVLGVADPVEYGARRVALHVEVEVAADQRHQPLGVGGVVDREARLEPELVDLLAQDPHAGRVEGADPHDLGAAPDQLADPLAHLRGRLVGEGDRQDRARVRAAFGDQPGDPPGQHPGLPGAGSRHDEQRRALVHHGLALRLVQPLEQLLPGRPTTLRRPGPPSSGVASAVGRPGIGNWLLIADQHYVRTTTGRCRVPPCWGRADRRNAVSAFARRTRRIRWKL